VTLRKVVFWLHLLTGLTAGAVNQAVPDHAGVVALTSCYHNLLRQWADP
jgi:predicted 2-oxoglutarate/Fe(II)-dependent dioxygenase YbiX